MPATRLFILNEIWLSSQPEPLFELGPGTVGATKTLPCRTGGICHVASGSQRLLSNSTAPGRVGRRQSGEIGEHLEFYCTVHVKVDYFKPCGLSVW